MEKVTIGLRLGLGLELDSGLVRGARVWVGVRDRVRIGLALYLGLELW